MRQHHMHCCQRKCANHFAKWFSSPPDRRLTFSSALQLASHSPSGPMLMPLSMSSEGRDTTSQAHRMDCAANEPRVRAVSKMEFINGPVCFEDAPTCGFLRRLTCKKDQKGLRERCGRCVQVRLTKTKPCAQNWESHLRPKQLALNVDSWDLIKTRLGLDSKTNETDVVCGVVPRFIKSQTFFGIRSHESRVTCLWTEAKQLDNKQKRLQWNVQQ